MIFLKKMRMNMKISDEVNLSCEEDESEEYDKLKKQKKRMKNQESYEEIF